LEALAKGKAQLAWPSRDRVEAGSSVPGRGTPALVVDNCRERERRRTLGTPGRCSLKRAALVVQSAQRRQFFVLPQLGLVHSAPKHRQRLIVDG